MNGPGVNHFPQMVIQKLVPAIIQKLLPAIQKLSAIQMLLVLRARLLFGGRRNHTKKKKGAGRKAGRRTGRRRTGLRRAGNRSGRRRAGRRRAEEGGRRKIQKMPRPKSIGEEMLGRSIICQTLGKRRGARKARRERLGSRARS